MKYFPLLFFISLYSCNEPEQHVEPFNHEKEAYFVDNFIPEFLKTEKYICITRDGSIQWSAMETMLIVDEDIIRSNPSVSFDAYYLTIDHFENKLIRQPEPSVTIHRIKMNGLKNTINLDKYDKICRKCIHDVYELGHGEGNCANFYTIRSMNSDSIIYVSRSSREEIKIVVKKLFSNISQQENFQSLSLLKNCKDMDSIAHQMMFNKVVDNTKYILPYKAPIRHN